MPTLTEPDPRTKEFKIRDLQEDLHRRIKVESAKRGQSMNNTIIAMLEEWFSMRRSIYGPDSERVPVRDHQRSSGTPR